MDPGPSTVAKSQRAVEASRTDELAKQFDRPGPVSQKVRKTYFQNLSAPVGGSLVGTPSEWDNAPWPARR
jgi:hypothetical protein